MDIIWTPSGQYRRATYDSEADLEGAIIQVQRELFGVGRIYLDVKKRIGGKNGPHNIPDGYLVDLTGPRPQLYVVENELAAHDPLRHIAVQILQFSLSFESEPRTVKTILFNALLAQAEAKERCEHYAVAHGYRNLDHMLEWLVFEGAFAALVIIDEMPENLENVLLPGFLATDRRYSPMAALPQPRPTPPATNAPYATRAPATGWLYIRESREDQMAGHSPETQERLCRELAAKEGITITRVIVESGTARTARTRKGWQEVRRGMRQHAFDVLLVWKYARMHRNLGQQLQTFARAKANGIRILAQADPRDEGDKVTCSPSLKGRGFSGNARRNRPR
jgi:Resolvase, N terminal domain